MENWKKTEVGNIAKINRASLTEKTSSDYEFFYIDIASVDNGKITFPTEKIQFKNAPSRARRIVQKDDVLMATVRPNLKSFAHFSFEKENVIASTGFAVLSATEKIDSNFLFHSIFSEYISKQISLLIAGSNYPAINSSEVENLILYLPPLPEQKKIAEILSTWDSAIETTEKLLTAKRHRKRALMQRLLTGKQRFPQFAGQAWIKLGAGEVFKNVSVKGNENEQLLSATQDKGIIPRSMLEARVTMPSGDTNSFKLVEAGDFVISLRSFQGGLEYSYYRGLVSPAYTVLKPIKKINDEFYKFYFKSYDFIEHLATAVIGIRDGKQISYEDFCFVKIPFPIYEEQTAISQILQIADKEIDLLKKQRDALKEQKRGLMQKLLTGKVRVKVEGEN